MALLLLDLDNTVADREAAFRVWVDAVLRDWAPDDARARAFLIAEDADGVRPRAEYLSTVRARFRLPTPVDELLAEYRRTTLAAFPPMADGARSRLLALRHDGWKVAVVTNGEPGVQEATAERVGLASLLDACIVSGAVGVRKPDPRIFATAAEACGEGLEGAWMIGDGEVDVEGAARAGLRSVWLTRGRRWLRDDVRPDHAVATLVDGLDLVASRS